MSSGRWQPFCLGLSVLISVEKSYNFPGAREVILKDEGNIDRYLTHYKTRQTQKCALSSWDVF